MSRLRISLLKLIGAMSLSVCLVASAAHYWRVATGPDVSHEIVLEFSESYSPPKLNSSDIAATMAQMLPQATESDLKAVHTILANTKTRVLPNGRNSVQIIASGKSWQFEPASLELLAHATARTLARHALDANVTAQLTSEFSSQGQSWVPQTTLSYYDPLKQSR